MGADSSCTFCGQEYGFKVGQPVTGKNPEGDKINYRAVRGLDGVKEANFSFSDFLWFRLQRQCLAAGDCAHDQRGAAGTVSDAVDPRFRTAD